MHRLCEAPPWLSSTQHAVSLLPQTRRSRRFGRSWRLALDAIFVVLVEVAPVITPVRHRLCLYPFLRFGAVDVRLERRWLA